MNRASNEFTVSAGSIEGSTGIAAFNAFDPVKSAEWTLLISF
jgi:hypothetical protein